MKDIVRNSFERKGDILSVNGEVSNYFIGDEKNKKPYQYQDLASFIRDTKLPSLALFKACDLRYAKFQNLLISYDDGCRSFLENSLIDYVLFDNCIFENHGSIGAWKCSSANGVKFVDCKFKKSFNFSNLCAVLKEGEKIEFNKCDFTDCSVEKIINIFADKAIFPGCIFSEKQISAHDDILNSVRHVLKDTDLSDEKKIASLLKIVSIESIERNVRDDHCMSASN